MAFRTNKTPVLQEKSVSGAVATFNTALAMPLPSCNIAVNAWQEGSGTPSPSNPRPISGWDAINIGNISDNTNISYFQGLLNGTYGFVDLGSLEYSMLSVSQGTLFRGVLTSIKRTTGSGILPNIICPKYITTTQTGRTEKSISQPTGSGNVDIIDSTYTSVSDFKTAMSGVYLIYELATPTTPSFTNAEFEALCESFGMNGQSFTIQIGSTVYGGEYDARTGVLTVTYKFLSFDYTSPWVFENSSVGRNFYLACPSDIKINQYAWNSTLICSASPISTQHGAEKDHCFISASRYFNFSWGETLDISSAQGFRDYLQANNLIIEVVAELATPQTIQLPPCPIDTLEGVNNIWADTGDIDLTYKDLDIAKRGNFREVFKLPS